MLLVTGLIDGLSRIYFAWKCWTLKCSSGIFHLLTSRALIRIIGRQSYRVGALFLWLRYFVNVSNLAAPPVYHINCGHKSGFEKVIPHATVPPVTRGMSSPLQEYVSTIGTKHLYLYGNSAIFTIHWIMYARRVMLDTPQFCTMPLTDTVALHTGG